MIYNMVQQKRASLQFCGFVAKIMGITVSGERNVKLLVR